MIKKIILWILVIFWMSLIFYFSNQNSVVSSKQSKGFLYNTIGTIIDIVNPDMDEIDKDILINKLNPIVRKLAHTFVFFILGVLVFLLVNEYSFINKKTIILSLIICLIYSISDEIHQLFISGRSCEIRDIIIDTIGFSSSIVLLGLINRKKVIKK